MFQQIPSMLVFALLIMSSSGLTNILLAEPIRTVDPRLERLAKGSDPMPRLLPSASGSRFPVFVAADRVLLPDGTVDPALFDPGRAGVIQRELAGPSEDDCIHLDMDDSNQLPVAGIRIPITEAIRNSENVVVGEVTGRIYGYEDFRGGTLLRVVTRKVLRGEANREMSYLHFPVGSFQVGEHRVCHATVGFPSPPAVGERLLLLYDDIEFPLKTEFFTLRATELVVLPKRGAVVFSKFFASESKIYSEWSSERFLELTRLHLTQGLPQERNQ